MNLQQLEYIIAVNTYRHFVTASEKCGVTQPTLSMMIQKLESELGITIFDRSKQPIEPTKMGERIIAQAEQTVKEMRRITEIVDSETKGLTGPVKIGVIPTLAPYVVPEFIHAFRDGFPQIELTISEMQTAVLIDELRKGSIDMFIAATPLEVNDFYEIPMYYEKFYAYFSATHPQKDIPLSASKMPQENLWVLQEGHCIRDQIFNFCTKSTNYNQAFEAGSIETLIKIVDRNGGYSVIPELHLEFLDENQKENVREIENPPAVREISLVIHKDYVKERMLNAVANTIKKIIPENMLDERLKKFSIKL